LIMEKSKIDRKEESGYSNLGEDEIEDKGE
jgi:hypothetical protein